MCWFCPGAGLAGDCSCPKLKPATSNNAVKHVQCFITLPRSDNFERTLAQTLRLVPVEFVAPSGAADAREDHASLSTVFTVERCPIRNPISNGLTLALLQSPACEDRGKQLVWP